MQLPEVLLESLRDIKGFDKEAFEAVHALAQQVTSIRINPLKKSKFRDNTEKVPWSNFGYYLKERIPFTFDTTFHAGCYYVQEASSMFLEQALKQLLDLGKNLKVLDLCAAPGGKSTHIQSLLTRDSLLVSNEVIRSRVNILKDNIIKWGCDNVVVTNNDPEDFTALENYFDVIVVDAPCSGSGLFRRDPLAIEEWSGNAVQLCSRRQQRILADVWPALKKNGILIYATCSYSKDEDEDIVNWLMNEFAIDYSPLTIHPDWGIVDTGTGYRFWPDKVKGEGFFLAAFQKKGGSNVDINRRVRNKLERVTKKEMDIIASWVKTEFWSFVKYKNSVYAWRQKLVDDIDFLREQLHIVYSGVLVGDLVRDKLVPDHALAMSPVVSDSVGKIQLLYNTDIAYLQKKEIQLNTELKGWNLVTVYNDWPLGWVNILPNRVNNYYPKSLRILKDI